MVKLCNHCQCLYSFQGLSTTVAWWLTNLVLNHANIWKNTEGLLLYVNGC